MQDRSVHAASSISLINSSAREDGRLAVMSAWLAAAPDVNLRVDDQHGRVPPFEVAMLTRWLGPCNLHLLWTRVTAPGKQRRPHDAGDRLCSTE